MYKRLIKWLGLTANITVKVYEGFGHAHNMMVWGHVLSLSPLPHKRYHKSILRNISQLIRQFFVKQKPGAAVQLHWGNQTITGESETDGFFRLEWASNESVPAGLHKLTVQCVDGKNNVIAEGEGSIFVPHITQLGIISDIDDTFLISYSASVFRRLWLLLTRNAESRKAFEGVAEHYRLLEYAQTDSDTPNPFFYVSSSEWNLYDFLTDFIRFQKIPDGIFLLSQLKRWYELFKTGKTKHSGKFVRIVRILEAFPNQQFLLMGDNSQKDPVIYQSMVEHYPERIKAVYIRKVVDKNHIALNTLAQKLDSLKIPYCFFKHSREAIEHSYSIGLAKRESPIVNSE